jgi:hypothetical protein
MSNKKYPVKEIQLKIEFLTEITQMNSPKVHRREKKYSVNSVRENFFRKYLLIKFQKTVTFKGKFQNKEGIHFLFFKLITGNGIIHEK